MHTGSGRSVHVSVPLPHLGLPLLAAVVLGLDAGDFRLLVAGTAAFSVAEHRLLLQGLLPLGRRFDSSLLSFGKVLVLLQHVQAMWIWLPGDSRLEAQNCSNSFVRLHESTQKWQLANVSTRYKKNELQMSLFVMKSMRLAGLKINQQSFAVELQPTGGEGHSAKVTNHLMNNQASSTFISS